MHIHVKANNANDTVIHDNTLQTVHNRVLLAVNKIPIKLM